MDEQKQLMSELQEDFRAYQLKQLWDKHGNTLIAVCVAAVIGTGLGVAWRDYKASRNATYTGQLVSALSQQDEAERKKALEAVAKAADGHAQAALAHFHLAADALEAEKPKDALAQYQAVADDRGQELAFRNLARLQASRAAADSGAEQSGKEVLKPGSPFYNDWREAEAWRLYNAGQKEEALARFSEIREDVSVSQAMRGRMQAVVSLLSPETKGKEKPAREETKE